MRSKVIEPIYKEKKVSIVIGKRGSGKSYMVKKMIADCRRLFVYDTQGEYDCGVCFSHEQYALMLDMWKQQCLKTFRIIYRPYNATDLEEFERVCQLVYALGNMTLICEEVHTYCQSNTITPGFLSILSRGRHKHIELIGVTQRPFGIHRMLTSQAKTAYVFSTNEPRDIQYLRESFGYSIVNAVQNLEQYQYARWEDTGNVTIEKA